MELQQLLKECKKGSITAQKYLFDRYSKRFFLLCRRYLKTNEQAEEVLMTGFLKIFHSLQGFSYVNDAAAIGWMQKLVVNECLQELRKKHGFLVVAEEMAEEVQSGDDVLASMSATEIYQLVMRLPVGYRTVFNLFVLEQVSHKEIAQLLNITEGTSKSQLSKARQMLQQFIQQQNAEGVNIQTR
jgi:RNA polymerase sigma-70 factor (ECF subfamily)